MTETSSNHKLAVVIPAFKPDFLAQTLACLAKQTDQRFNLYIGDDASPADIQAIAWSALGTRPFAFKRFEKNLGGTSLPRHWDRCVALSNEPWVWLFSDDDLMDDNCVAAFYKFLETSGDEADVLRFDAWTVNEASRIVGLHSLHPDQETGLEFAYGYLMGCRHLFMQQHVFRRRAFDEAGGFLDLPLGWATDAAAVIAMGRKTPIRRIPGARVSWRCSRQNITPDRSLKMRKEKLRADCLFLEWLKDQLQTPRELLFENDDAAFLRAMDSYLLGRIATEGALPALANWNLLSRTRTGIGHRSRVALLKHIAVAAVNDSFSALEQAAKQLVGGSSK